MGAEGDQRLVEGPNGEAPGRVGDAPAPAKQKVNRSQRDREDGGGSDVKKTVAGPTPFHVVARGSHPQLLPLGGEMFVAVEGTLGKMRSGRLSFGSELTLGADTCGAVELLLYGGKPADRWLMVRFPPFEESPPRDKIYRYVPSQKSWRSLRRQPAGGADLMFWDEALIGIDTYWGGPVEGARIRIFDGKTTAALPGATRAQQVACDRELGGLEVRPLGDGALLLLRPSCDVEPSGRVASLWDDGGQKTPFEALPLAEEHVFGSGAGPVAGSETQVWVAFEAGGGSVRQARLLHHDGTSWSLETVPEFSFISKMSALPDGTLWMISGEPGVEGSTLWMRSNEGEFSQVALPAGEGAPTSVHAAALDDVWVSTTLAVVRTLAPEEFVEVEAGSLSSCGDE